MTESQILRPGRRFLHVCYCCDDADAAADFFVSNLGLRVVMSTPLEPSDGSLLGIDVTITSKAVFVYDHRGPRVSPSIEIQEWADPHPTGSPSTDPFEVGVKALGIAVADLDVVIDRLTGAGCALVARGASPFESEVAVVRDPVGVVIELTADPALQRADTRLAHLRITVGDLDESLPFYDALGFDVIERGPVDDGGFVGHHDGGVTGDFARLRLPDEPFECRLIEWHTPRSHGRHYPIASHRGIFRAAMAVDDTRASYDAFREAGMTFDRPPREVELHGTPVPDMWITFISDPNGIPYEFVQRPRSAFR